MFQSNSSQSTPPVNLQAFQQQIKVTDAELYPQMNAKSKGDMFEQVIFGLIKDMTSSYGGNFREDFDVEEKQESLDTHFSRFPSNVYALIVKRMKDEMGNIVVLLKCFKLLSRYMVQTMPNNGATLYQIEQVCDSITINSKMSMNRTLLFEVKFIQKLLSSFLQNCANGQQHQQLAKEIYKAYANTKAQMEKDKKSHKRGGDASGKGATSTTASSGSTTPTATTNSSPQQQIMLSDSSNGVHDKNLIKDFYGLRLQQIGVPSVCVYRSIADSVLFGGQFKKTTKFEDKQLEIDVSSSIFEHNPEITDRKIEEIRNYLNCRRRQEFPSALPQFQWRLVKYFELLSTQQSETIFDSLNHVTLSNLLSDIADQKMTAVSIGSLNVNNNNNNKTVSGSPSPTFMASVNLLIHLFGRMLEMGKFNEFQLTRQFFFELLESKSLEKKQLAFALLYNIALYLKAASETAGNKMGVQISSASYCSEIFDRFNDMALASLFLLKTEDNATKKLWIDIFLCLQGLLEEEAIDKPLLMRLDIRIIAKMVTLFSSIDGGVHTYLIDILLNILNLNSASPIGDYLMMFTDGMLPLVSQTGNLHSAITTTSSALSKIGGIFFIIDQYLSTSSNRTRRNLFTLIFDYLVQFLLKKKRIKHKPHVDLLFELLCSSDIALYLPQIFKSLPENFVDFLARFLYVDLVLKDNCDNSRIMKDQLDPQVIIYFCLELQELVNAYQRIEDELIMRWQLVQKDLNTTEHFKAVKNILASADPFERKQGMLMLFLFLKNDKLSQLGDILMNELSSSSSETQLLIFLELVERFILHEKSKFQIFHDEKLKNLMKTVNDYLSSLLLAASGGSGAAGSGGGSDDGKAYDNNSPITLFNTGAGVGAGVGVGNVGIGKNDIVNLSSLSQTTFRRIFDLLMNFICVYKKNSKVHLSPYYNHHLHRHLHHQNNGNLLACTNMTMVPTILVESEEHKDDRGGGDYEPQLLLDDDDLSAMFRKGMVYIPVNLVREINISILRQLFLNLDSEKMRAMCLILISEKCKKKPVLEGIGGLPFFRFLTTLPVVVTHADSSNPSCTTTTTTNTKITIGSNNYSNNNNVGQPFGNIQPSIAWYASKFILNYYSKNNPDLYCECLKKIVIIAQSENDSRKLDNYFFQNQEFFSCGSINSFNNSNGL